MIATSSPENQNLNIFLSHDLSSSINIPTRKAGNILYKNVNQFESFMVVNDLLLTNHCPNLFNCLISRSSSSTFSPLASSCSVHFSKADFVNV